MGFAFPITPVIIPWFAALIQLYPLPPNVSLLCACMCDAFLRAHRCARLSLPGAAQQNFGVRLRLLTRRHVAVAEAWVDLRAGPG
eukprot:6853838-Pyramimonas_sp.AAC.1